MVEGGVEQMHVGAQLVAELVELLLLPCKLLWRWECSAAEEAHLGHLHFVIALVGFPLVLYFFSVDHASSATTKRPSGSVNHLMPLRVLDLQVLCIMRGVLVDQRMTRSVPVVNFFVVLLCRGSY